MFKLSRLFLALVIAATMLLVGCENETVTPSAPKAEVNSQTVIANEEDAVADNPNEGVSEEGEAEATPEADGAEAVEPESETEETETAAPSKPAETEKTDSDTSATKPAPTTKTAAHEHDYYRPRHHYKYIGDGTWDGSGWRDEEDLGVVWPTCTEGGYTVYVCSVCEDVKLDNFTEPLGHTYSEKLEYVYSGRNKEGYTYHSCERCHDRQVAETFAPINGDLSKLHSCISFKAYPKYDVYWIQLTDDEFMEFIDCRLGGNVPEFDLDFEKQEVTVTFDIADGTVYTYTFPFPVRVRPGYYFTGLMGWNGTCPYSYSTWN